MTARFSDTQLVLDQTPKAMVPFGGRVRFIAFLGPIGFAREG